MGTRNGIRLARCPRRQTTRIVCSRESCRRFWRRSAERRSIRLRQLALDVPAQILVKLEALNPGGSIKDRVGVAMVAEAERQGWLGRAERS